MKAFILSILSLLIIAIISVVIASSWLYSELDKSGIYKKDKIFLIEKGQSVRKIAKNLEKTGLIKKDWLFLAGVKILKADKKIRSGEYLIPAKSSVNQIINIFTNGRQYQYSITIPEGLNIYQVMEIINNDKNLIGDVKDLPKEGSILPETYSFTKGTTRNELIKHMQKKLQLVLAEKWQKRAKNLPLKNKQEALILASIIEKETGIKSERKKVAGVFINRLRKGMKLQTDPTVIYAITDGGKNPLNRPLYTKDLEKPHKFNTYYITGLPPAPICNAGIASIEAALNPEKHNYLYFVADGTGGHKFAKTLKEHNRNVRNWRKINKK